MPLRLKKSKEKALLGYHPWVFSGAIHSGEADLHPGEITLVETYEGKFLGYGHFEPKSQIRVRMFSFDENQTGNEDDFWNTRFSYIYEQKKELLPKDTNGFRFLHSEADGVPGVTVDCYADVAVLQLRTFGGKTLLPLLIHFLKSKGYTHILEKNEDAPNKAINWIKHMGDVEETVFLEYGKKFFIHFPSSQKTGFFLDQRENRRLLGELSMGKRVLNTFAYSGAFSVYALKNGAKSVHSLDISKDAILLCEKNLKLNGFTEEEIHSKHLGICDDSFSYLKSMPVNVYDLIVLDPPAFTKSISSVNQATRGYKEINMKAISKIQAGGLIFTFSCSQHISMDLFKKIIFGAAKDCKRPIRVLYQLHQSPDHAFSIYHPEGDYLKGLVIQVD